MFNFIFLSVNFAFKFVCVFFFWFCFQFKLRNKPLYLYTGTFHLDTNTYRWHSRTMAEIKKQINEKVNDQQATVIGVQSAIIGNNFNGVMIDGAYFTCSGPVTAPQKNNFSVIVSQMSGVFQYSLFHQNRHQNQIRIS